MKKKIRLLFFIKICILIYWIYHFSYDRVMFNKLTCAKKNNGSKLRLTTYRVLAKYRQNKDSCILGLRKEIQYNKLHRKKDIHINDKEETGKKKTSNGCSLNNLGEYKQALKNKFNICETKKYSRLEKKIFKELDYVDFLKNSKTISDKVYKNIVLKKCGIKLALPLLLFFMLSISLTLDLFVGCGIVNELYRIMIVNYKDGWIETLCNGIRVPLLRKCLRVLLN
ncbi:fam-l protein [Plasmodium malariae]|uniref:Fam-l protein n=1 Tax=Plasmodium malariae TaxID=5858 RepID=A0A1D3PAN8_PLAMA|nr:fam-l protein [Plasmodium malariae]SCN11977.1 fam-l protein [Plasmodium malariae]